MCRTDRDVSGKSSVNQLTYAPPEETVVHDYRELEDEHGSD